MECEYMKKPKDYISPIELSSRPGTREKIDKIKLRMELNGLVSDWLDVAEKAVSDIPPGEQTYFSGLNKGLRMGHLESARQLEQIIRKYL
jgi:hypothetical protein